MKLTEKQVEKLIASVEKNVKLLEIYDSSENKIKAHTEIMSELELLAGVLKFLNSDFAADLILSLTFAFQKNENIKNYFFLLKQIFESLKAVKPNIECDESELMNIIEQAGIKNLLKEAVYELNRANELKDNFLKFILLSDETQKNENQRSAEEKQPEQSVNKEISAEKKTIAIDKTEVNEEDIEKFVVIFEEHLASLEAVLSKFENDKNDLSKINSIAEIIDKLKKTVINEKLQFLIKPLEWFEDAVKKITAQNIGASSAIFDFMFESVYYLKEIMKQLSSADAVTNDTAKLLQNYNKLIQSDTVSAKPAATVAATKMESNKNMSETVNFTDYSSELVEWDASAHSNILEDFIEEAQEIIEELSKSLVDAENSPDDHELLNLIFRSMHTLKGNSATLNLKIMNLVAHRAENVLDKIRTNKLKMSSEINDVMLECVDAFQLIIKKISEKQSPNFDVNKLLNNLDVINTTGKPLNAEKKSELQSVISETEIAGKETAKIEAVNSAVASAKSEISAQPAAEKQPAKQGQDQATSSSSTIRVDISKLDKAMNLMGEIIIDKIRLRQKIGVLYEISNLIDRILSENEKHRVADSDNLLELSINDKLDDFFVNYKINPQIYRNYYNQILKIRELVQDIFRGQAISDETDYQNVIDSICAELRRINQILKESVNELMGLSEHFDLISGELQESIMQMRMIPIQQLFDKIPRIVRSVSRDLKKNVNLIMTGGETELDKTVIEQLNDPFIHLMRNSVDHGVELPETRTKNGKNPVGEILIAAEHLGNQVIIRISDDGKGIDDEQILNKAIETGVIKPEQAGTLTKQEILNLIFLPGFSSAEKITEVSGRGVGMDVVKSNIRKLKGTIELDSKKGEGTTISIRLPLTMSVMQVQLIECSKHTFAIPINFIEETINVKFSEIEQIGSKTVFTLRGEIVSLLRLSEILELPLSSETQKSMFKVIIIKIGDKRFGLIIDKIIGQQDIVLKSLGDLLKNMKHISGATILGEGKVVILLDMLEIFETIRKTDAANAFDSIMQNVGINAAKKKIEKNDVQLQKKKQILVVDDSKTITANMCNILNVAGFEVEVAYDGVEAFEKAKKNQYDLFTVDIMMPKMDGYKLTQKLREQPQYNKTPVIMVSSKTEKIDKLRGLDSGADEYITKPFNENELVDVVRKFLT